MPSSSHWRRTLSPSWPGSMRARLASMLREFFFEILQIHFEAADLLEEQGGVGLLVGLGVLAGLAEEGGCVVEQLGLPVADEGGVDLEVGGQFVGGAVPLQRRQRHLRLELRRVRLPFLLHLLPLSWASR